MFMLAGGEKAASQLAGCMEAGAEAFNRARFLWPIFSMMFSLSTDTKVVRLIRIYGEQTMFPVFSC